MELLDIGIATEVGLWCSGLDNLLVVALMNRTYIEPNVFLDNCGHDQSEQSNADVHSLGMQVIDQTCSGIECVAISLKLVVRAIGLHDIFRNQCSVCIGEDGTHIVDIVIDGIALDAVVGNKALNDTIVSLYQHLFLRRRGEVGHEECYKEENAQNDELSEATVHECFSDGFVGSITSVLLIHNKLDLLVVD